MENGHSSSNSKRVNYRTLDMHCAKLPLFKSRNIDEVTLLGEGVRRCEIYSYHQRKH